MTDKNKLWKGPSLEKARLIIAKYPIQNEYVTKMLETNTYTNGEPKDSPENLKRYWQLCKSTVDANIHID